MQKLLCYAPCNEKDEKNICNIIKCGSRWYNESDIKFAKENSIKAKEKWEQLRKDIVSGKKKNEFEYKGKKYKIMEIDK